MIAFETFVNSPSKSARACVAVDNYVNEIDVNKLARCFYSAQRSADRNTETGSSAVSVSQVESKIYVSEGFSILVYNDITCYWNKICNIECKIICQYKNNICFLFL